MTVKTAALSRQQLESVSVAVPGRRIRRPNNLVAFVALVGFVELAWVVLLYELVSRIV